MQIPIDRLGLGEYFVESEQDLSVQRSWDTEHY